MTSASNDNQILAKRLQGEIIRLDSEMRQLAQEKAALERQLLRLRRENLETNDVNRKNSINRIIIEDEIIKILKNSEKSVSTKNLRLFSTYISGNVNESTFRTYLHRMKLRGLIESAKLRGHWKLPTPPK